MYSITRRGTPKGTALLAVLQAILLLSALVLSPAAVVAQDGDHASGQAPQVEAGAATDPAPAEPAQKVRIYPKVTKLFPGGKKVVSAWHCPADIGASFGPDKEPGTGDDDCTAVRAKWSLEQDDVASLSNVFGYKTRVTLRTGSDTEIFAEVGDKTGKGRIVAKDKPAKVRPQANKSGTKATTPEAPVIVPVPEEPADDCSVDPLTGECLPEEPGTEPEPTAEPAPEEPGVDSTPEPAPEEPGTEPEPTAEPAPDPKDECDIDPLTGKCVGEAPVAEPAPEPEPTAAPKTPEGVSLAADDGTLRILKGGYRGGGNDINGLAGARFDIWEDDGDNNFEPGGDDDFVRQSGATNSNGAVNESLQPGRYWVREATAPAGWNKILQMAYGSGSNSDQDDNAYVDRYQVSSNSTTTTDRYVNRLDNNSYPDVCGLKVALVFDRSGSISDSTEYPKMKNAAKDFVDALKGTPSQFRVYSFSWSATTDSSWTSVADNAGATAVKNVIDGLPPTDGGTNWDAAFREVAGDGAEVIVFLTDGNPTTYGDSQPFEGSTVHLIDVELGVASANNAKNGNAQPKVVAVGIGNAVANPTNLKLISGPNVNDDYYIANFDNLKDKLQQIASKLCGGTVTVLKEIPDGSGGWMADSGWTFSAASSGAAPTPTSGDTNGQGVINFKYDLSVAPYTVTATVTETPEPGWELVKQGGKNAVCRDNGDTLGSNAGDYGMTFSLGIEDIVTCTFRNQQSTGTLKLVKTVINDDGGTATVADFQARIDGADVAWDVAVPLAAGGYTASEQMQVAGYTASDWGGDCASDGSVTVISGEDAVCTITNDDTPASLKLVKTVINDDGGTATAADFQARIDGADVAWDTAIDTGAGSFVASEVANVSGYAPGDWGGDCDAAGNVTIALGEDAVCTITNDDTPASLKLVKTVINDDGGTATAADFQARIDGADVAWDTAIDTGAGSFVASEVANVSGYAPGDWGGDCDAAGNVTIALGEDAVCTITNDDTPASLKLVKTVINDDGGTATAADFQARIDGADVAWDTAIDTGAGSFVASEVANVSGYAPGDWGGDCDAAGNVTIALGEDAVCTITNDDTPASLKLVKTVINDDGGTATAADFQARIDGADVAWDTAIDTGAGSFVASEVANVSGYAPGDWGGDCDAAGNVTIALGEDAVCTITNDDIAPKLTLVKRVNNNNGGDAQPDDFGISVDGSVVTSGQANTYAANQALVIDETGLSGYAFVEITGDGACPAALGGTVTLQPGDDVTCTIVNADQPSTITLIKEVVGGPASAADFDAYIGGQQVSWGVATARVPGSYVASEVMNVPDYVAGAWRGACDAQGNVELALGENLTCRITNFHAALRIVKSADPSFYAEVGDVISYTITGTNIGQTTLTGVVVSDNFPGGLDGWNCSLDEPATLAIGEDIVCTATHTIVQADLNAGQVFNQACIDSNQTADEVCDDETVRRSRLTIVKEADRDYYSAVGDVINYTITATNAGQTALTNVDITDNLMADLDNWVCRVNGGVVGNPVPSLASGDAIVCTASYTIVAADMAVPPGTVFNQACADSVETPEVCDDVETPVAKLEIVKEASTDQYAEAGERVTYTITATNTGVADLTDVDITDSLIEGLKPWACTIGNTDVTLPVDRLLSGASIVCSATYTTTRADVERGTVFNQACVDSDETPQDCDDVTIDRIAVDLIKDVDASQLPWPGGTFGYTLTVHNLSVVPVEITSLTDTNSGVAADFSGCTALIGTSLAANDGALGGADTASCTYTVDRFGDDTYPNVADVIVTDDDQRTATDQDDATVVVPPRNPEPIDIDITKTPDQKKVKSGTAVIFTLVFDHQTEAPPIYLYELTDNVYGDLLDAGNTKVTDNSCLGLYGTLLLPSTEYSCQFTGVVKGTVDDPHINKATITVTDVDPLNPVPVEPRFASATDKAKVKIKGGGGSGGGGGQPPTDMLPVSDSIAAVTVDESGSALDGAMSWAIWLLLSTLLIFSTGWVIRRERFAQVKNR